MYVPNGVAARACLGLLVLAGMFVLLGRVYAPTSNSALGQEASSPAAQGAGDQPSGAPSANERSARLQEADRAAKAALAANDETEKTGNAPQAAAPQKPPKIPLWELYKGGGVLMVPITALSFLAVVFAIERILGLRRRMVLPPELIRGLGKLASQKGGLDPREAYRLCQQFPSAAANVIKTMLLKVGRPHTELEHAVAEASQREATRLYRNVRWLDLSAGISPLLGLLGTVQGMIIAFFVTANLPVGANKARILADGIYVALVTTFGGLVVAIPAAMAAHFFEGRIQRLLSELDEMLLGLLPQLERFEGRLRVSKDQFEPTEQEPVRARPETPLETSRKQHPSVTPN